MGRCSPLSVRRVVFGLVGALVVAFLVVAGTTLAARLEVASAQDQLHSRWRPAQSAALDLEAAFVDQETGQRGFLLTGDPSFLAPYLRGARSATHLEGQLRRLLATDATAEQRLAAVSAAAFAWRLQAAEPEIAARRQAPLPASAVDATALRGKELFDILRGHLAALMARTNTLTAVQLARISDAERTADIVTVVAAALAVLIAVLAFPLVRRALTRPLATLLASLRRVSAGAYDEDIDIAGPAEFAAIGADINTMRESILRHSDELVAVQNELTLRRERDRLAADLHDLSIQRVFGLGLSLSARASRDPALGHELEPLITETDRIIRELRSVIFDVAPPAKGTSVRSAIGEVVHESERALGFVPNLELRGPIDAAADGELGENLLAVLHEALSNVARHAGASRVDVTVVVEDGEVSLTVLDDGRGPGPTSGPGNGVRNAAARAAKLGGRAALAAAVDGGACLAWRVPVVPRAQNAATT